MRSWRTLLAVFLSTAVSSAVVTGLAVMVHPLVGFGVAALLIVIISAVYHRRLRDMADSSPTPAAASRASRRLSALPFLIAAAVLAVAWIAGAIANWWRFMGATGSGGIGSISVGVSEAIIEIALMALVAGLVVFALVAFFGRGRSGGDSQ